METKILLVEDNPFTRKTVKAILEGDGYTVLVAPDGMSALKMMEEDPPSLVILDLLLPDISGFDVSRQMRSIPPNGATIPILAFSGLLSGIEEAKEMGYDFSDVILKPVEPSRLLEVVRSYLPIITRKVEAMASGQTVLIVDDNPVQLKLRAVQLRQAGFKVVMASDGLAALKAARSSPPDAIVSDILLPGMDGFHLCQAIRSDPNLSHIPVVLNSVFFTSPEDQLLAQQAGASRLIECRANSIETIQVLLDCLKGKICQPVASVITENDYSQRFIRQLENHAALYKNLLHQSNCQAADLAVLNDVSRLMGTTQDVQSILEALLRHTTTTGEFSRAVVYFYTDQGDLALSSQIGYDESDKRALETFFGHFDYLKQALETRRPTVVPAKGGPENVVHDIVEPLSSSSMFIIPILFQETLIGGLILMTHIKKIQEASCLNFAQTLATQISHAVELNRSITRIKESEERFRQLAENINETFFLTGPVGMPMIYISPAYERVWDRSCQSLYDSPLSWHDSLHPEDRERVEKLLVDVENFNTEYRIIRPDGSVRWIDARTFPIRDQNNTVYRLAGFAEDITKRKQAEETVHHIAFFDTLTGLPNRNQLLEKLWTAIRNDGAKGKQMALMIMDLNRFKEINGTLGYQRGDLILKEVGKRLKTVMFDTDLVARLGGDEFAVLLRYLALPEHLNLVVEKIRRVLEPAFMIEGLLVDVEASVGIALYPDHGGNPESLLQRADIAMHGAKKSGIDHVVYDPKYDEHSPRRLALTGELRQAIENDQLFLHYQPKIDFKSGSVVGVEALIRWIHPRYGPIPPDQFILPAEQTGVIQPLTSWVLKTALDQLQKWRKEGLKLHVAVNLSARNLHNPKLPDELKGLLKDFGIEPGFLELEITESAIMMDPEGALQAITRMSALGIRFALDDFGVGYSSLAYLKKLPVDSVKIDKIFIADMMLNETDLAIVRSIINLGHNLRLNVVAEGVETLEVWDQLFANGCDEAQGFYMGRPMTVVNLERWLKSSPYGLK